MTENQTMSEVTIRIPAPLRNFTGGADEVRVQGSTVREALESLGTAHQGLLAQVTDADGNVRRFVNVYLQDRNVAAVGGLDAEVPEGAVISIIPAVAGGAR